MDYDYQNLGPRPHRPQVCTRCLPGVHKVSQKRENVLTKVTLKSSRGLHKQNGDDPSATFCYLGLMLAIDVVHGL